ncbi:hypothetical protein CDEF62S_04088 [Castellaniella defragrans]
MIDVLLPLLPASLATLVQRLSNVIVLVVLVVMTLLSTRFTVSTFAALTPVLRLPQSVIYAASAVGFALHDLPAPAAHARGSARPWSGGRRSNI